MKGESWGVPLEEMLGTPAIWGEFPPSLPSVSFRQVGTQVEMQNLYLKRETEQLPSRSDMQIWIGGLHHSLIVLAKGGREDIPHTAPVSQFWKGIDPDAWNFLGRGCNLPNFTTETVQPPGILSPTDKIL